MDYKGLWKSRPFPSVKDLCAKRQLLNAERDEKRKEFLWGSRVAGSVSEKPERVEKKKNPRAEMLLKWKAEKMKKLEEEKKKRKPVFKVGAVQKKATGSPLINQSNTYVKKNLEARNIKPKANYTEPIRTGVLTRAKAKNMELKLKVAEIKPLDKPQKSFTRFYKYEGGKRKQIDSYVYKVPEVVSKLPCSSLTFCYSPKLTKKCKKSLKFNEIGRNIDVKKVHVEVAKDENHTSKTQVRPNRLKKQKELEQEKAEKERVEPNKVEEQVKDKSAESFKGEVIDSQPCNVTLQEIGTLKDDYIPVYYSPFVTVRSGKKSKRNSKKSLAFDIDEQIKKEEDIFKCRLFSFRKYIDCETNRLLMMCEKWKHIYEEFQEVPTEVEGDIDSLIGKTNLLTSDKFMQFKGLIDKCENGDPFVKIDDLQGFQDWVSIEVERIDEEFHKLEKRKCNNWKSETTPVDIAKARKVKVVKKTEKKVLGKSDIRSHILAARKLLKERNANCGEAIELPTPLFELVKTTTPKKKESLLKEVLTSETKKKRRPPSKSPVLKERRNSGLEIMIATQKNKFPTPAKKSPCLTDFEILIEKEVTPSKSILKKVPKTLSSSKGHVKFENVNENTARSGRGLSEKYFRPVSDDEMSPMRSILGDLGNLPATGMITRSKTRQLPFSPLVNQQIN